MIPFYVFTTQRSGSTVLIRTLDQHPDIFCAGELFFPGEGIHHQQYQYPFLGKRFITNNRLLTIINKPLLRFRINSFIENFYKCADIESANAGGFKLMLGQYNLSPLSFQKALEDKKCILLIRKNLLKMAISKIQATDSKVYHVSSIENESEELSVKTEKKKLQLAPAMLYKILQKLDNDNSQLLKIASNALKIEYEEFSNWANVMDKITHHLKVKQINLSPVLKKIGDNSLENTIENFDEVRNYLSSSRFSYLIEKDF